jgi:hypothetical protein
MLTTVEEVIDHYNNLLKLDWLRPTLYRAIQKSAADPSLMSAEVQARLKGFSHGYSAGLRQQTHERAQNRELLGRDTAPDMGSNLLTQDFKGRTLEHRLRAYFANKSTTTYLALHDTIADVFEHLDAATETHGDYLEVKQQFLSWLVHEIDGTFRDLNSEVPRGSFRLPVSALLEFKEICTFACSNYEGYREYINAAYEVVLKNRNKAEHHLLSFDKEGTGGGLASLTESGIEMTYRMGFRKRQLCCTDFGPVAVHVLRKHRCRGVARIINNGHHVFALFENPQEESMVIDLWLGAVGKQYCYPEEQFWMYPFGFDEAAFKNPAAMFEIQ